MNLGMNYFSLHVDFMNEMIVSSITREHPLTSIGNVQISRCSVVNRKSTNATGLCGIKFIAIGPESYKSAATPAGDDTNGNIL